MIREIYGLHLILRISNISQNSSLSNNQQVSECLKKIIYRIGMRILAGPISGQENEPPENRGCSAVIILYESHAAIHTYAELGEAFVDIFSCRTFDVSKVKDTLTEYFGSYRITEQSILNRGYHWGCNIQKEMNAWLSIR